MRLSIVILPARLYNKTSPRTDEVAEVGPCLRGYTASPHPLRGCVLHTFIEWRVRHSVASAGQMERRYRGAMHHRRHLGPFARQRFFQKIRPGGNDLVAVILQAGLLTPLAARSTAQTPTRAKGTAGAVDGTRLDLEARKWESK